jgi:hypothetical protein
VKRPPAIGWLRKPEAHDYPAARSYLSLLFKEAQAKRLVRKLKGAPLSAFKSRDIFRASALPLLGLSSAKVQRDRKKILAGTKLSPLLLVRARDNSKVIVADGYHRLCAVYGFDEDAVIPCKIV